MSKRFNHLEPREGSEPVSKPEGSAFRRKLERLTNHGPLKFLRAFRRKVEIPGRERDPSIEERVPPPAFQVEKEEPTLEVEKEEPTLEVERPEPIRRHAETPRRDLSKTKSQLSKMAADLDRVTSPEAPAYSRPRSQTTIDREAYEQAVRPAKPTVAGALLKIGGGLLMGAVGLLIFFPVSFWREIPLWAAAPVIFFVLFLGWAGRNNRGY